MNSSLGSLEQALNIARRAAKNVAAYGQFLSRQGIGRIESFSALPLMDKQNYISPSPYRDLLADDYDQAYTIFKSSGSSGQSFYWPQLKHASSKSIALMSRFLEDTFRVHERRTLVIVGLALGSWIGGEHASWALKSFALTTPYPFSVFSPGSNHDEILAMMGNAEPFVDQFLLFLCPSAISRLHLKAEDIGAKLPHNKLRYMVLGESFPESLRMSLQRAAGVTGTEPVILSLYGSADTGFLGVESPATVLLRQFMSEVPELAALLGISGSPPHFFHFLAGDVYLEVVDGELCVTRWQGIPLVRYNLHDSARLIRWETVQSAVSQAAGGNPSCARLAAAIQSRPVLPDLIAISGRSDGCLILCGTNISEAMLDEAIRAEPLSEWLTGMYKASVLYDKDRQHLALDLEWRKTADMDRSSIDKVYTSLVRELGRVQPEFMDDWRNVYRAWDGDSEKRILRINPVRWPGLSSRLDNGIKHRGTR